MTQLFHNVKKTLPIFFISCFFTMLITGDLQAQRVTAIQGKILAPDGEPLQAATVELPKHKLRTTTDKDGMFHFEASYGTYTVRINMAGYADKTVDLPFIKNEVPEIVLTERNIGLEEVVITATRTEKNITDVPLQVTVIRKEEIQQKGMVRLNEVLAEQIGVVLDQDHGTGIQLQGFDAKYTSILIDGEPVVGRSSGTLELSRITLANVERVEIIKGPSSSLYGSEAMAGVINIITKKPSQGNQIGTSVRYGTNEAFDVSLDGSITGDKIAAYGALNRFSNNGYQYGGENTSSTVPPFYGYTGNFKIDYNISPKLALRLSTKYNDERSTDQYATNVGIADWDVKERFVRRDISFNPGMRYRFSDKHSTDLRLNQTFFRTDTRIQLLEDGSPYNHDYFNQDFARVELQHDYKKSDRLHFIAGAGMQYESLRAVRYDHKKKFEAGFVYAQADVKMSDRFNFIAGGRFDMHSVYPSQFSPKLAAQYKTFSWLTVHGTVGSGYKAPDFRELYLNWNNPTQGYSVFGAEEAKYKLAQLVEAGQIAEVLYDPDRIQSLDAERSWNYQLGAKMYPTPGMDAGINLFSNQVSNLIETFVLATKTNGKSVYIYSNQDRVTIKGLEANLGYRWRDFYIRSGFQYLQTANKDVLKAIGEGREYYTRDPGTGSSRLVKRKEYGGLFNRSRYTFNSSLTYDWSEPGINLSVRWTYRGRFGIRDIDGNGILNMEEEYAKGYSIFNATASKSFIRDRITTSISSENIGNIRHTGIATMPGRLFFLRIAYRTN